MKCIFSYISAENLRTDFLSFERTNLSITEDEIQAEHVPVRSAVYGSHTNEIARSWRLVLSPIYGC